MILPHKLNHKQNWNTLSLPYEELCGVFLFNLNQVLDALYQSCGYWIYYYYYYYGNLERLMRSLHGFGLLFPNVELIITQFTQGFMQGPCSTRGMLPRLS